MGKILHALLVGIAGAALTGIVAWLEAGAPNVVDLIGDPGLVAIAGAILGLVSRVLGEVVRRFTN